MRAGVNVSRWMQEGLLHNRYIPRSCKTCSFLTLLLNHREKCVSFLESWTIGRRVTLHLTLTLLLLNLAVRFCTVCAFPHFFGEAYPKRCGYGVSVVLKTSN